VKDFSHTHPIRFKRRNITDIRRNPRPKTKQNKKSNGFEVLFFSIFDLNVEIERWGEKKKRKRVMNRIQSRVT
jgi:hypothetical protein